MNGRKHLMHIVDFYDNSCDFCSLLVNQNMMDVNSASGILSLSALSNWSVYLGHDDELHWLNETRANNL